MTKSGPGTHRFDGVVFDAATGDVRRPGADPLRLRPQAAKVLEVLLERPGELVSRDAIRDAVWAHTVVEFDQGVNACIREIRRALGDTPTEPRFVETLPRRGYRFLPSVEVLAASPGDDTDSTDRLPRRRAAGWFAAGITVAVGLLAVVWFALADSRAVEPPSDTVRLLVVPFRNASTEGAGDTLASVLSDRLIAELARFDPDALAVIARTSAIRYSRADEPLAVAATALDLDVALEGSITHDDGFALELRMIDPATESHTWAARYAVDPGALAAGLDRVSHDVLDVLGRDTTSRSSPSPSRLAAREDELRVEYLLAQHTMAETMRADTLVRAALAEHGSSPGLHAALAEILRRTGDLDGADRVAERVLGTAKAAEGHRILAASAIARMRWDAARTHVEQAIEHGGGSPEPLQLAAFLYAYLGRSEESVEAISRARALDPISSDLVADAGVVLMWAGRHDEARRVCREALVLEPHHRGALRCVVDVAWATADPSAGEAAAATLLGMGGGAEDRGALRRYWAESEREATGRCAPVLRAKALVALGRARDALEALRSAPAEAAPCFRIVAVDPYFDELRADPHVRAALGSIGLDHRTAS